MRREGEARCTSLPIGSSEVLASWADKSRLPPALAFTIKYAKNVKLKQPLPPCEVSLCFLGDGAVAQGAFHESLNIAALWDLPCHLYHREQSLGHGNRG